MTDVAAGLCLVHAVLTFLGGLACGAASDGLPATVGRLRRVADRWSCSSSRWCSRSAPTRRSPAPGR